MVTAAHELPRDRDALISLLAQNAQHIAAQQQQIETLQSRVAFFEEQYRLLKHKQFGPSSETTVAQALLFNEAELAQDSAAHEADTTSDAETQTVAAHTRTKRGRKGLPETLPTERIEYTLPEEERICPCCNGPLHAMSTECREELEFIPARIKRIEHVRHVYGCRECERCAEQATIVTAPAPQPPIPRSYASANLLAHIITAKFVYGLPLYRLESQFELLGVSLPRSMSSQWLIRSAGLFECIYGRLQQHLRRRSVLHADETTVQVLREPGREAQTKSFMWLYRSAGADGPPIVLFDYQTGRDGENPRTFLDGFRGYLHVDGYAGYEGMAHITLSGCWAHARREFHDAIQALPKDKRQVIGKAHQGLAFCNRLFEIERKMTRRERPPTPEERQIERERDSRPVLDEFHAWLGAMQPIVVPKSALGKAVGYCLNQWEKLGRFMEDGRLEIDNNRAERSIKPFVIGRKAWMFANTPSGARASAVLYSLVETAKENRLDPAAWLAHLLREIPNLPAETDEALDALMPWNYADPSAQAAPAE
jgi:transposase